MDALSIAASGITAASNRFGSSAERLASGTGDIAAELTEQVSAKIAFEASVSVARTSAEMSKQLLDILA